MRNFSLESRFGLERTLKQGVIKEPRWLARVNMGFLDWATTQVTKQIETVPGERLFEKPFVNPGSFHYFESTRGLWDAGEAASAPFYRELARVSVPFDAVGVVKSFGQLFAVDNEIFSNAANWGTNPQGDQRPRWHFRLTPFDGEEPPIFSKPVSSVMFLPGVAHSDFPYTDDLLYPLNSPTSERFHLIIPGGNMLRVIIEVTPISQVAWSAQCLLRGYTTGVYHESTMTGLRTW